MKPTLLILAAGMGSRYGGLKQMDGLGKHGETIIDYSIYDAIRAGFGKVVLIIRPDIEDIVKAHFADTLKGKIEVEYVFQQVNTPIEGIKDLPDRVKPWGTGHAMLVAENAVDTPFAVINADDFYGKTAFEALAKFLTTTCTEKHLAMIGYRLANTLSENGSVSRGECTANKNNFLTRVTERISIKRTDTGIVYEDEGNTVSLADNTIVSMNCWAFHPVIFAKTKRMFKEFVKKNANNPKSEFFIPLIANSAIKNRSSKIEVIPTEEQWYGITYTADRPTIVSALAQKIANNEYPSPLWGK
jgi:NDP-sugar pyrophosphorylase family protein